MIFRQKKKLYPEICLKLTQEKHIRSWGCSFNVARKSSVQISKNTAAVVNSQR